MTTGRRGNIGQAEVTVGRKSRDQEKAGRNEVPWITILVAGQASFCFCFCFYPHRYVTGHLKTSLQCAQTHFTTENNIFRLNVPFHDDSVSLHVLRMSRSQKVIQVFFNIDIFSVCRKYAKGNVMYVMLSRLLDRSYDYGYASLFGTHRMLRRCPNLWCTHTELFLWPYSPSRAQTAPLLKF